MIFKAHVVREDKTYPVKEYDVADVFTAAERCAEDWYYEAGINDEEIDVVVEYQEGRHYREEFSVDVEKIVSFDAMRIKRQLIRSEPDNEETL